MSLSKIAPCKCNPETQPGVVETGVLEISGRYRHEYRVECTVCGAAGPSKHTQTLAIRCWNSGERSRK